MARMVYWAKYKLYAKHWFVKASNRLDVPINKIFEIRFRAGKFRIEFDDGKGFCIFITTTLSKREE